MTKTALNTLLIAFVVNWAAPMFVAVNALHASTVTASTYYGTAVGQTTAAFSLSLEILLLCMATGRSTYDPRFPAAAVIVALPATILMAWPRIGMFSIFSRVVIDNDPLSPMTWLARVGSGTLVLSVILYVLIDFALKRPSQRLVLRSAFILAAIPPLAAIAHLVPILAPIYAADFYGPTPAYLIGAKDGLTRACGIAVGPLNHVFITNDSTIVERSSLGAKATATAALELGRGTHVDCGISADANGEIAAADAENARIVRYRIDRVGRPRYVGTLAGRHTRLERPSRLGFDGHGRLFVLDGDTVLEFAASAVGDRPPKRTLTWKTRNPHPCTGFAVDRDGNLYLKDCGAHIVDGSFIAQYGPGAAGDARPRRVIAGSLTGLAEDGPIAVDERGDILALTNDRNIVAFAPSGSGDTRPEMLLKGPLDVRDPGDIAVGSAPYLLVADRGRGNVQAYRYSPLLAR